MKRLFLFVAILALAVHAHSGQRKRKISDSELRAVIQAVEDEIYDYGYQKKFYHLGENVADATSTVRTSMHIYIDPEIDSTDESGRVIYKLMPYGEVLRDFIKRRNGLVVLSGDPQNGFPQTQESSTKTVYLDDAEVCGMKHDWIKSNFVVDDSPSPERVQDAANRQKLRTGFSDWEYRSGRKSK